MLKHNAFADNTFELQTTIKTLRSLFWPLDFDIILRDLNLCLFFFLNGCFDLIIVLNILPKQYFIVATFKHEHSIFKKEIKFSLLFAIEIKVLGD
jgi:hypothetical protein